MAPASSEPARMFNGNGVGRYRLMMTVVYAPIAMKPALARVSCPE